jgi:hypothetical protein
MASYHLHSRNPTDKKRIGLIFNTLLFCTLTLGVLDLAHARDGRELFEIPKSENRNKNSIYGYWVGPNQMNGEVIESTRLRITGQSIQLAVRCEGFFETEYVSVNVPALITENTIEILQSDSRSKYNPDFICNAEIEQTSPTFYRIINGHLHFQPFVEPYEKLKDL